MNNETLLAAATSPNAGALRQKNGESVSVMIDGFNLGLEKGTGVATYARNLSYCLRDMGCEVGVLYGGSALDAHRALLKEISFFDSQSVGLTAWERIYKKVRTSLEFNFNRAYQVPLTGTVIADTFKSRLPYYDTIWNSTDIYLKASAQFEWMNLVNRISFSKRPDIVHWTYPLPIRARHAPNVYTLHDLVPLRLPYTTLDRKDRYLKLMKWIGKTADHIVTVSECSRRDLINILGLKPERVTNTYQAVTIPDKYRLKPEDVVRREIEGTFGLKNKNYYLFFGSIEPKKNVGRMIEGYLASGVEAPLVIVGAQAWKSEQELRLLYDDNIRTLLQTGAETRVKRRVIQLEYASFPLLVSLIRGAKGVLFPSLYEGFGLPVLESMLLGTPVLTSNTSSIPEVAGDAALMVDPYDTRAIAEGIRALDTNESLRGELSERGRKQAALFSEAAYRTRLSEVYREVLARSGKKLAPVSSDAGLLPEALGSASA